MCLNNNKKKKSGGIEALTERSKKQYEARIADQPYYGEHNRGRTAGPAPRSTRAHNWTAPSARCRLISGRAIIPWLNTEPQKSNSPSARHSRRDRRRWRICTFPLRRTSTTSSVCRNTGGGDGNFVLSSPDISPTSFRVSLSAFVRQAVQLINSPAFGRNQHACMQPIFPLRQIFTYSAYRIIDSGSFFNFFFFVFLVIYF